MKKFACLLYSVICLAVCAVPGVMLFGKGEDTSTAEKRQLAEMPSFKDENNNWNKNWSSEFQSYVADHFGFRQQLVNIDSHLKADLLHISAEEQVIIGKDGWLFYTPTVNDYLGKPTVSEMGIKNIRHNLEMMQEFSELHNSQFLVAIVPNKNSVYGEYMPENYQKLNQTNNYTNLMQELENSTVPAVDLLSAFNKEELLYHKQDTHWNNTGALLGYRAIMDKTGKEYQDFSDAEYHIERNWEGDLQNMLFPESEVLDDNAIYDISFDYLYQGHYHDTDDININTISPNGTGSVLMFRDSFGAAIIPYFSQNFQMARYSRARPNPLSNLETTQFDLTILEIVERNIAWLQKEAPLHSALKAETIPETENSGTAEMFTDRNGTYLQFYGTVELPENLTSAPEYIFTLKDTTGKISGYRAYNCYESDKLNTEEISDNGWSLYISSAELTENETYQAELNVILPEGNFSCALGEFVFEQE